MSPTWRHSKGPIWEGERDDFDALCGSRIDSISRTLHNPVFFERLPENRMASNQVASLPHSQRAIKVVGQGSIQLERDVALPELHDEDVLVRVHCVALNPFDW